VNTDFLHFTHVHNDEGGWRKVWNKVANVRSGWSGDFGIFDGQTLDLGS
jgi:hypothetical protein